MVTVNSRQQRKKRLFEVLFASGCGGALERILSLVARRPEHIANILMTDSPEGGFSAGSCSNQR